MAKEVIALMEYVPVEKDKLPYRISMQFGIEVFELEFHYNNEYDYFTINLFKDGDSLVLGEKIVYNRPLFEDVYDQRFPAPTIKPVDESGSEDTVTYENLNETVFLVVMNA